MNEPDVKALIHQVVAPMFEERDRQMKNRLDYQDRVLNDQTASLNVIKKHQLEMYGNGSGKKGMLDNMRDEQKRMHDENRKAREKEQQETEKRLKAIESGLEKQDLRKEVLKELLDEQEQVRIEREAATKKKWDRGLLVYKVLGGSTLTWMLLRYLHGFWLTHSLFAPVPH